MQCANEDNDRGRIHRLTPSRAVVHQAEPRSASSPPRESESSKDTEAPENLGSDSPQKSANVGEQPIPSASQSENDVPIRKVDPQKNIEESGQLADCEV